MKKQITLLFIAIILSFSACKRNEYQKYFNSGMEKLYKGQYKEAIDDFTKAIEEKPTDSAYYRRGVCEYNLYLLLLNKSNSSNANELLSCVGYSISAENDFDKTIELNSNFGRAFWFKAEIQRITTGENKEAIKNYTKALELIKKNDCEYEKYCYYGRAHSREKIKDYKGAESDFTNYIQKMSKDTNITALIEAYMSRGNIRSVILKNKAKCLEDYYSIIKLKPNYSDVYIKIADVYLIEKKFDSAKVYYSKALELNPVNYEAFCHFGNLLKVQLKTKKAIEYYDKAIELNPKYSDAYYFRGICKWYLDSINEKYDPCSDIKKAIDLGFDGSNYNLNAKDIYKKICEKPDLQILQKNEIKKYGNFRTICVVVKNNTTSLMSYVELNATWYDSKGTVVGTGMGNTTNLAAGAKRTIEVTGMDIYNAVKYELSDPEYHY